MNTSISGHLAQSLQALLRYMEREAATEQLDFANFKIFGKALESANQMVEDFGAAASEIDQAKCSAPSP